MEDASHDPSDALALRVEGLVGDVAATLDRLTVMHDAMTATDASVDRLIDYLVTAFERIEQIETRVVALEHADRTDESDAKARELAEIHQNVVDLRSELENERGQLAAVSEVLADAVKGRDRSERESSEGDEQGPQHGPRRPPRAIRRSGQPGSIPEPVVRDRDPSTT